MLKQILSSKPFVVVFVFIALMVPLSFIQGLIYERQAFHQEAVTEVSASWTGTQVLLGPVLVVDYRLNRDESKWNDKHGKYVDKTITSHHSDFIPMKSLSMDMNVDTEVRYRGIHSVPVYTTTLGLSGRFDPMSVPELVRNLPVEDVVNVYLWIWVSDQRGFTNIPDLTWADQQHTFRAGGHRSLGGKGIKVNLTMDDLKDGSDFHARLSLKGAGRLSIIPTGETAQYEMVSDWQHPKFLGRYLPDSRSVEQSGFTARWHSTVLASNIGHELEECAKGACESLLRNTFGVELLEPVDEYLQAERAIKYGFLFILLVFAGVMFVEIVRKLEVHPLQYGLIGAAMAMFYLLLISLSEHLLFVYAYVIATTMSTALLGYYGVYVLRSLRDGMLFGAAITSLYGVLYIILRAEDTALLMGTLLTFFVLTVMMVATRDSAWLTSFKLMGDPSPEPLQNPGSGSRDRSE